MYVLTKVEYPACRPVWRISGPGVPGRGIDFAAEYLYQAHQVLAALEGAYAAGATSVLLLAGDQDVLS